MPTASVQFLVFAAIAALAYHLVDTLLWREVILLVANAYFLYTFINGLQSILPFVAFLVLGYIGMRTAQNRGKTAPYVSMLVLVIGVFVWLKKYTFLPSDTFLSSVYVTIGLSYVLFRVLHLMIDARSNNLPDNVSPLSYLNYTLNFMTLVSGPIQLYEDFRKNEKAVRPTLTVASAGVGIHRIAVGFFKVSVLSWICFDLQKYMLGALAPTQSFEAKVHTASAIAVAYTLYLYFNFSGYTDIVIGVGRVFGFTLPENFDRPLFADNFMSFWNRWHMTLSNWFKTYVFNPMLLGGLRKISSTSVVPFMAVPVIFVTFFLVGVWHGRTFEFLFFGFLTGFGVAANLLYDILLQRQLGTKRYRRLGSNAVYVAFCRGLTFTWFTFTLLWFWSNWAQITEIRRILGFAGVLLSFTAILLAATVLLSLLETARNWILAIQWMDGPAVLSPYTLTVIDTGLAFVTFVVVVLLQTPAPENIYKAF